MYGHPGAHHLGRGLEEEEALGKVYDHRVVLRLLSYSRGHVALLGVSLAFMLLYTLSTVATPWLVKEGIDALLKEGGTISPGLILALFLANGVVGYASGYVHLVALARISQSILYALRTQLFCHLQRLSLSFYDHNEVGRVMSRVQNDVAQLQEFFSVVVLSLGDVLGLIGIVVVMFTMSWRLALLALAAIPLLFGMMALWQRYARRSFVRVRRAISVVNAGLQENISGIRVIQSLNREKLNLRQFDRVNYEHLDANLQASRLSSGLLPLVELLTAVSIGLVIVVGGGMALRGELALGVVVAFVLYIQRFFDPIRNLTMQYTQLQRAMTSGERVFHLLDTQPQLTDPAGAAELPAVTGEIRLEGVRFAYEPGLEVIRGIDLSIRPGEKVALVGPTGAGKSSLVALMVRFYDVTGGRILIDGVDVRDVPRFSLARQTSLVLQEPFLFSGTVAENIRYGRANATSEQVERAAAAVGAHDFITRLPQGYETPLYERGNNLSAGQRQLISFARAVLGDPRIIFLDEATASVDSYTESLIQRALARVLEGRTAIIIAHRLSTIRSADRIVVLSDGRIVEQGAHEVLLAQGGLYARLWAVEEVAPNTDGLRPAGSPDNSTLSPFP
ncbi:MAG: ABC transporter ATP-binding protein [Chloroflexi bacterium]|nr:ABC transporter ATP-binding protein [Chloroflexota bacterium]